jgi:hypothetical protein
MKSEKKPTNPIAETIVKLKTEVDLFSEQIEKNNSMIAGLEPLATWEDWPEEHDNVIDVLPETLNVSDIGAIPVNPNPINIES